MLGNVSWDEETNAINILKKAEKKGKVPKRNHSSLKHALTHLRQSSVLQRSLTARGPAKVARVAHTSSSLGGSLEWYLPKTSTVVPIYSSFQPSTLLSTYMLDAELSAGDLLHFYPISTLPSFSHSSRPGTVGQNNERIHWPLPGFPKHCVLSHLRLCHWPTKLCSRLFRQLVPPVTRRNVSAQRSPSLGKPSLTTPSKGTCTHTRVPSRSLSCPCFSLHSSRGYLLSVHLPLLTYLLFLSQGYKL